MADAEDWRTSGERMVPELSAGSALEAEHVARYRFVAGHIADCDVVDLGCGVGWGSRLLLSAGAATVTGVDLFAPAIEYAEQHYAGPQYLVGDMSAVPLPDGCADVVVCMEAIEHVHDHGAVLAEARRLLRPGGLFFVSSPNPDVYPEGNPFHVHEVGADELRQSLAQSFSTVAGFAQELLVASVVGDPERAAYRAGVTRLDTQANGSTAQYAIAVASDGVLPSFEPELALAVSTQLTHLQAVHAQLIRDREEFQDQADAVAAEQRRLQAEIATAQSTATALADERRTLEERLVQAGRALEQVMAERDDAARQLAVLAERLAEAQARNGASDAASDAAQHALEAACRERDETLFALLRSEQDRVHDAAQQQSETDHLAAAAAGLAHELTELRHSSSWRVTAPMRWLKDAELRRRARP
ncbi:MAG: hypothetical protein QOE97_3906 [Pseudonocardiales bacterium]|jgi:SAM-dependent methyltransferase|nr:hypothetical protein [Pseudonocardiales bacterium]